jgi:ankyrin repeat protein
VALPFVREYLVGIRSTVAILILLSERMDVPTKQVLITAMATAFLAGCGGSEPAQTQTQHSAAVASEQASVSQPPNISLQEAAIQGNVEAIKQHIAAGSDVNERDPTSGSSPLITAATFGQIEAARAVMEGGADVNAQNNEGSTPLHTAAFLCRTEIVKVLLENGADKNA